MDPFQHATWTEDNVKNLLQYFFQSAYRPDSLPEYQTVAEGPPHMKHFYSRVYLPPLQSITLHLEKLQSQGVPTEEFRYGVGEGKTKKESEKKAAADACRKLELMNLLKVPSSFKEVSSSATNSNFSSQPANIIPPSANITRQAFQTQPFSLHQQFPPPPQTPQQVFPTPTRNTSPVSTVTYTLSTSSLGTTNSRTNEKSYEILSPLIAIQSFFGQSDLKVKSNRCSDF